MIEKETSVKIQTYTPDHLRLNHQQMFLFLKYYYEWLETIGVDKHSRRITDYLDVDLTTDMFFEFLRNEFMSDLPVELIGDQKKILKNIKDFYRAKGSEQAFKFLFRVLYNEDLDFYYPGEDILRASAGHWIVEKSIYIITNKQHDFQNINQVIGETSFARGTVDKYFNYINNQTEFEELFLTNIQGTFIEGENLLNAETDELIGKCIVNGVNTYPGRYEGTYGFLSSDKRLQDNFYYQEYSYVLKSGKQIDSYREVVNKVVHPIGTKMFGQISLTTDANVGEFISELSTDKLITIHNVVGPLDFLTDFAVEVEFFTSLSGSTKRFTFSPIFDYSDSDFISVSVPSSSRISIFASDLVEDYEDYSILEFANVPIHLMGSRRIAIFNQPVTEIDNGSYIEVFHNSNTATVSTVTGLSNMYVNIETRASNTVAILNREYKYKEERQSRFKYDHDVNSSVKSFELIKNVFTGNGTIALVNGSNIVTGSGTAFSSYMNTGDVITIIDVGNSQNVQSIVTEVVDNDTLLIRDNYNFTTSGLNYKYRVLP